MKLYLVTDEKMLLGKDLFDTVENAVKGGVTMVQLREKNLSTREFVLRAIRLKSVLTPYGVPLIINDRIDVALASNADGVHIGQSDMPYNIVRKILPKGKVIGISVENQDQVIEANSYDVDYIAASPVFSTSTKTDTLIEWGINGLKWISANSNHKLIAIGGINSDNVKEIIDAGADGVAVVSGILSQDDPRLASERYLKMMFSVK